MHELSLCRSISTIVTRAAQGRPVAVVELEIGQLRQVVPETLTACWAIVSRGTSLENARLDIRQVPAGLHCRDCGRDSPVTRRTMLRCAACASTAVDVTSGDEMLVSSLLLEDSDGTLSPP